MRLPAAFHPLRHPTFRALWTANTVVALGTWFQNTAAGWLMTSLAPEPLIVSMVQAATILPVFLFALPAGAVADIVDRRRFLLATQGWMLASAALLAALTLTHRIGAWGLLGLTFAIGAGSAMNQPAWQAVVSEVVPREDLVGAVVLNGIGFNLARAVGPALAGALVLAAGPGVAFALTALSFLGIIAVLALWPRPPARRALPPENLLSAMRVGMGYVRHTPAMRAAILRSMAYFFPAAAPWAMLPLVVREQLGLGAGSFGLLLGLMGAGGVAAGLLLPRLRLHAGRGAIVTIASALSFCGVAVLSLSRHWLPAAAAMTVFGVGWVAGSSTISAAAQLAAPAWVRARALGIYQLGFNGALAAGSFVWGWLGDRLGLSLAMALAAGTGALLVLATRRLDLDEPAAPGLAVPLPMPDAAACETAPELARRLRRARGRVMETTRYRVPPAERGAFLALMAEARHVRGRAGALVWQLWEDVAHPDSFLEAWTLPDWTDHLRERTRLSESDKTLLARLDTWRDGPAQLPSCYVAVDPEQAARNVA